MSDTFDGHGQEAPGETELDREAILAALASGPKSSTELGLPPLTALTSLRVLEAEGLIRLDPDMFPDEYVPGNPLIARLPGDDVRWPGWSRWNI